MDFDLQFIRAQLAGMWRWRWIGLAICWSVVLLGTLVAVLLPDQYQSRAKVKVDNDSPLLAALDRVAIGSDFERRVRTMEQLILTRPNIERVIRDTDIDLEIKNEGHREAVVADLAQRIRIEGDGSDLNIYTISFVDPRPARAQGVVQALLNIFVETNLGENRDDLDMSIEFLDNEIAQYERQLNSAEGRVADFRTKNIDVLAGTGSYVEKVTKARDAVVELQLKLKEAELTKNQIERQLAVTPQYLTVETAPQVIVGGDAASGDMSTGGQIRRTQAELERLRTQYTEEYPDVKAAKRRLEELLQRQRAGGDPRFDRKSTIPNPLYEQITLKLVEANSDIIKATNRLEQARIDLTKLEAVALEAPQVEAEMASIGRDYVVIKDKYDELLKQREKLRLQKSVEVKTEAVAIRVAEPPAEPRIPVGPPRALYLVAALVVGMGGGIASTFLRAQLEDTFPSTQKLQETFGLPVLGSVSNISDDPSEIRSVRSYLSFGAIAAAPVAFIVVMIVCLPLFGYLRGAIGQMIG